MNEHFVISRFSLTAYRYYGCFTRITLRLWDPSSILFMNVEMLLPRDTLIESFITDVTRIWFLSSVGECMYSQGSLLHEGLSAVLATVVLYPFVHQLVIFHGFRIAEGFATNFANSLVLELVKRSDVNCKSTLVLQLSSADLTFESTGRVIFMNFFYVIFEPVTDPKLSIAVLAGESLRSDSVLRSHMVIES
jgi:hypothetical protein